MILSHTHLETLRDMKKQGKSAREVAKVFWARWGIKEAQLVAALKSRRIGLEAVKLRESSKHIKTSYGSGPRQSRF